MRWVLSIKYRVCKGRNIRTWRSIRRFFSACLCFLCRASRGGLALSRKLCEGRRGSKDRIFERSFSLTSPTHTHTQTAIVFVKSGMISVGFVPCPHEITMRNNNQCMEVISGRAGVGLNSLSRSFYGLLEPRDVCTRHLPLCFHCSGKRGRCFGNPPQLLCNVQTVSSETRCSSV
jgi:hypothetical protein